MRERESESEREKGDLPKDDEYRLSHLNTITITTIIATSIGNEMSFKGKGEKNEERKMRRRRKERVSSKSAELDNCSPVHDLAMNP